MCAMNQFGPEDRLSKALRRLAQESVRNAPPELGLALAGAFRAHHRRRKVKTAAVALVATVCLFSAVWLVSRPSHNRVPHVTTHDPIAANTAISVAPKSIEGKPTEAKKRTIKQGSRRRPSSGQTQVAARETGDFFPLPAYDPVVLRNDLQIVRVEMPVQDLRLVGVPVDEELSNRRVLADFVVGHDGTPYAVRFVH